MRDADPPDKPQDAPPPKRPPRKPRAPRPRRGRWHRFLHWLGSTSIGLLLLAGMLAALAGVYLRERPLPAPAWVQARIEQRLEEVLPQAEVTFGEMVFVMDGGWTPRVRLRDLVLRTPEGAEVLRVNEFKATFAGRPLLEGQVQPQAISLSGLIGRLVRTEEGRFVLSGGLTAGAPRREAATLPQLIGELDAVMQSPALSALTTVDLRAVTLRYEDRRAGRAWTVDGARARLNRQGRDLTIAADLALLGGGAEAATLEANYSSIIGATEADFGVSFDGVPAGDIAAQGPAFAWLDILRAPISGSVRTGLDAEGRFEPLNATLQIGAGVVQPNEGTRPIPFEGARSYFRYLPRQKLLRFDALSVRSAWISGEASGTASLGIDPESGRLEDLVAQIELADLSANPQRLYPEPVTLSGAGMDFRLALDPFRVELGRLEIRDGARTLRLSGGLTAEPEGWRLAVDGQMAALAPERLLTLWPEALKPKTRAWLDQNLLAGEVRNADLAFRADPGAPPRTYLAFDFTGASARFLRGMPPIEAGQGHFSLNDNRMVVTLDAGEVTAPAGGAVDLAGSSFIIPDVRVKDGAPSISRLRLRGGLQAALSVIDQPPLRIMSRVGQGVDLAEGRVLLEGAVAAPLKKGNGLDNVSYHFDGTLRGVTSDSLVKGRTLTAENLDLSVTDERVEIGGAGELDGVPFTGTWRQPIGKGVTGSSVSGSVTLSPGALETFGVALPRGAVSGEGEAAIEITLEKGARPSFALSSDLRGLRVAVPQVGWVKPAAQEGTLEVAGTLGSPPQIERLRVGVLGLQAAGRVELTEGGGLERVRFDDLRVGDWLDAPVDLLGRGRGNPVQVVLRGGSLDLRRANLGEGGGGGAGGGPRAPLGLALDRLQITDTIALTDMRGDFTTGGGGLDGSFEARLNGGAPVQGRVTPRNGRTAVRLTSSDAGGVLRSAGLLRQIAGGEMDLVLLPVGAAGSFEGDLKVTDVRVRNAPGIAALLNAVSVVGLINELNGDGIYFDTVQADFALTPDRLILREGSAVGASMGLSMDGLYGLESNNIAMQGVITPVYLLNGIGSLISRRGEGLIGFNYSLSGPARDPEVSVNPLSALAPGAARDLFRTRPRPPTTGTRNDPEEETQKPVVRDYEGR